MKYIQLIFTILLVGCYSLPKDTNYTNTIVTNKPDLIREKICLKESISDTNVLTIEFDDGGAFGGDYLVQIGKKENGISISQVNISEDRCAILGESFEIVNSANYEEILGSIRRIETYKGESVQMEVFCFDAEIYKINYYDGNSRHSIRFQKCEEQKYLVWGYISALMASLSKSLYQSDASLKEKWEAEANDTK